MTLRTAGQFDYFANRGRARAGVLNNSFADRVLSYVNAFGAVREVHTVTVTAANSATYSLTLNGITVSYVSDASATVAEILIGLRDRIRGAAGVVGNPTFNAFVNVGLLPNATAPTSLTLTTKRFGDSADISGTASAGSITVADTTPGSNASALLPGVGVVADPLVDRGVRVVSAAALVQRQVDLTPSPVDNAVYSVEVAVAGSRYLAQFTADGSATAAEIVDGLVLVLDGILPANTVAASNDSDNLRLQAEVAGLGFSYAIGSNDAGATWAVASDNNSKLTDVERALLGVSGLTDGYEAVNIGQSDLAYPPGGNVNVLRAGVVIVDASDVTSDSESVFIGTGSGEEGLFFASAGAGRIALSDRFEWYARSINNRAVLYIR